MPYTDLLIAETLPAGAQPLYDVGGERILLPIRDFSSENELDAEVLRLVISAARLDTFRMAPTLYEALAEATNVLGIKGIRPSTVLVSAWDRQSMLRDDREKFWLCEHKPKRVLRVAPLPPSTVVVTGEPDSLGILCRTSDALSLHDRRAGILIHADAVVQVKIGIRRTSWDWVCDPTGLCLKTES